MSAGNASLVKKLMAKLKKRVYIATVRKYLKNYVLDLDDLKIIEHLKDEKDKAGKKPTYTDKRWGIKTFFLWYIDKCDGLLITQRINYADMVERLIKNAPKFDEQKNKFDPAEDKKTIDLLNSSLLYCGLLFEEKKDYLEQAFVLQAVYSFGVTGKFFEKLTFDDIASENILELINS